MRSVQASLLFVLAAIAQDRPHLVFSRVIGSDWQPDAHRWMNFVAISSDGRTVAANGNTAGGETGSFGLWSFPGGDYLRSISGWPVAISPDFRYLATGNIVRELETGRTIFQISHPGDILRSAAFSPNGELVALVGGGSTGEGQRAQVAVLKTADGSRASRFGSRYTKAVAFHPD